MGWALAAGYNMRAPTPAGRSPKFLNDPRLRIVSFPPQWMTSTVREGTEAGRRALCGWATQLCNAFDVSLVQ